MQIDGPCGLLESKIDIASETQNITAIVCHPHPQYGGSMRDGVVETAANVLLNQGIHCIRFNFRGVGASAGQFDDGIGETHDLMAVSNWAREEFQDQQIWWVGYSFGAAVVWQGLQTADVPPDRAILIAPPLGAMAFDPLTSELAIPIYAVAGSMDNFVDQPAFANWKGISTHLIPNADHFFSGAHDALEDALRSAVD